MKKVLLFTFIFLVVSGIFAEHKIQMPDFKYIVQKQMEAAEMKMQSYAKWMDGMREDTREMDNYDVRYYFIDIDLGYTYQAGDMIELAVQYSGYPQNRLNDGMKFQEHNGVPVVFTMVSPKGARKWWPCKDTPADKPDSLDIWITYPSQYICASNGTLQEVVNNGNGTSTGKWHEAFPICTYLTSFAITNYQMYSFVWEYEGTQMMVDNYIYPEQYAISVSLYELCEDMLTFYSDIYGEYPFITEKYGHATCTNLGALAMEHQTCTSFDSGYISDPAAEYTIAHELGHSWAGDCLSIGSWSHVWLKEGFASYSEALWAEHLYGTEALHEYMLAEDSGSQLDECLYRDENGSANHIFNIVIYRKGSWVLHMLRGVIGDEDFFQMLIEFMQDPDLKYGNILTEDLENSTESVTGYEMDWFFDEWFWNYGRPRYKFVTYTSDVYDSLKVTLYSEGSQGDPFSMFVPCIVNGETDRIWVEDGFNYETIFMEGELDSLVFDYDNWVLDYGYIEQIPHLDEVSINRDGAAVITWEEFFDPAVEGFNVYRKETGGEYVQLNTSAVTGTAYFDEDVIPGEQYYYKIAAVFDSDGNYLSKFSNEISVIPVDFTLDQGILLVDGTWDYAAASPFPTDEEVDEYYDQLLQGYTFTNWDVNENGLPPLEEIAQYSSIIWHTDDMVNHPFNADVYNVKSYLLAGGNLLVSAWKLLFNLPQNFSIYYLNFTDPHTNVETDFAGAFGQMGFPDIAVDTDKIPLSVWGDNLQYVNKFIPAAGAEPVFLFDSAVNDPEWENAVCGQKYEAEYNVYVFGFPLYYMQQPQAQQIVNLILQDFGESTSVEENFIQPSHISLYNYPNPFNPTTTIKFTTENTEKNTELIIYNMKGQKIKQYSIFNNQSSIVWNGTDESGNQVSSGIYFYQFQVNGKAIVSKKMLLLK